MEEAIAAVEAAFAALGRGDAQMPAKIYLTFPAYNGDLRAMPAFLPAGSAGLAGPFAGVKIVNSHPDNPSKGLPTVAAVLVLNDPKTGMPLAVMAAGRLTDIRTGAAGGVAAKHLARKDAGVLGLVGCGRQAASQLEALQSLFELRQVRVAGRSRKEAEQFCLRYGRAPSPRFVACGEVREACEADIVVTTTPSRRPVVMADWIRPGTHINAIGADAPGKQELESTLLAKARVFVDRMDQASHSGEVNVPLSTGALRSDRIAGELGDVVLGTKKGRTSPDDITVFDSTGLAVQDVAVAARVYQRAIQADRGIRLSFSGEPHG